MKSIRGYLIAASLWGVLGIHVRAAEEPPHLVAPGEPLTAEQQREKFHLPEGFEIQLVAAEPEVRKPINLNFDFRGRLLVTQSVEYPYAAKEGEAGRDALLAFVDTDGDGIPDQRTVLAEELNIPIGVSPAQEGYFCYSIPQIYWLRGENAEGQLAQRTPLLAGFGYRDTHGMASSFNWWMDGWVYACHGFANDSSTAGADGNTVTMNSGNTFRFRPDGSRVEQFTWGQVNPFGLAFDPLGNLYSSDCHTHPAYQLLRGAYYPSFGKPHDGLGFGPQMMEHLHGSTGIAGIVYYAADHFPAEYRDGLLIGNPVTGRVNRDRLDRFGSSYRAIEQPDFLTCDDPWFRPVDVRLAPDGSLYVADFYNRIIGHYEVRLDHPGRDRERGRIWRIVYKGADSSAMPPRPMADLTVLTAGELVERLADPNLLVRTLATHQLVHRIGPAAASLVRPLLDGPSIHWQRVGGLWVLERLEGLDDATLVRLSYDTSRDVRVHVMKLLAERRTWTSAGDLSANSLYRRMTQAALNDSDPFVVRAAADALGQHPDPSNIVPLLQLWDRVPAEDSHLLHVVRMALRNSLRPLTDIAVATAPAAEQARWRHRLAEVTLGVKSPAASVYLLDYLRWSEADRNRLEPMLHHATRQADESNLPAVFVQARTYHAEGELRQREVLRAVHQGMQERKGELPAELQAWALRLAHRLLLAESEAHAGQGIDMVGQMRLTALVEPLAALADAESRFPNLRNAAVDKLFALAPDRAVSFAAVILAQDSEPAELRSKVIDGLATVKSPAARALLKERLLPASAAQALPLARALANSGDGGIELLDLVEGGKVAAYLLQDAVVKDRIRANGTEESKRRLDALVAQLPPEDERIAQLLSERRQAFVAATPDLERGRSVFAKNCGNCHQIAGQGARIGPQLDGIGLRGLDRVLEDVLMPSRNVDQAFRGTILALADGRILTGLVLREEGDVVVIADGNGQEVRIETAEIEERRVSNLSPMPADVAQRITDIEFLDLIGFLVAQREAAAAAPSAAVSGSAETGSPAGPPSAATKNSEASANNP